MVAFLPTAGIIVTGLGSLIGLEKLTGDIMNQVFYGGDGGEAPSVGDTFHDLKAIGHNSLQMAMVNLNQTERATVNPVTGELDIPDLGINDPREIAKGQLNNSIRKIGDLFSIHGAWIEGIGQAGLISTLIGLPLLAISPFAALAGSAIACGVSLPFTMSKFREFTALFNLKKEMISGNPVITGNVKSPILSLLGFKADTSQNGRIELIQTSIPELAEKVDTDKAAFATSSIQAKA
ncbi:MAG TPA: hypothetical protein V6C96_02650, partial [Vampirovibrionales bacterium]